MTAQPRVVSGDGIGPWIEAPLQVTGSSDALQALLQAPPLQIWNAGSVLQPWAPASDESGVPAAALHMRALLWMPDVESEPPSHPAMKATHTSVVTNATFDKSIVGSNASASYLHPRELLRRVLGRGAVRRPPGPNGCVPGGYDDDPPLAAPAYPRSEPLPCQSASVRTVPLGSTGVTMGRQSAVAP